MPAVAAKQNVLLWLARMVALIVIVLPLRADLVTLDFTTGYPGTDMGTSATFGNPPVVVTGRSDLGNITTPLTLDAFTAGLAATLFWGELGNLDGCTAANCPGLGVVAPPGSGGGNKAISGATDHKDEVIIFNWAAAEQVSVNSIILTLQAFNPSSGTHPDEPYVYIEFVSNTNPAGPDYVFRWENITTSATLDFSTLGQSGDVLQVAVLEQTGLLGIGGLQYEAVPEPASFLLVGVPLIFLGLRARRARAR